jgi:hypothetical protein
MTVKVISWGLMTSCIVLASVTFLPYQHDDNQNNSDNTKPAAQHVNFQITPSQQYQPAELDQYSAITEFPLFNPLRQLTKEEPIKLANAVEKTVVKSMPKSPQLIGVMTVEEVEMAFVLGKGDSEVVGLEQGEKYKDWTLTTIEANQIVMTYNDTETVIEMNWLGKDILQAGSIGDEARENIQGKSPFSSPQQNSHTPSIETQDRLARQLEKSI